MAAPFEAGEHWEVLAQKTDYFCVNVDDIL